MGVQRRRGLKPNVVNLTKGDREGRPYKCLNAKHLRRGDLHGRPYVRDVKSLN
jgi:hypothetical protein